MDKKLLDHFISPPEKPKKPTRQERLYQITAPLWDADMGKRLQLMRMMLLIDQTALGAYLGTSQKMISEIERGERKFCPAITVSRLEGMFGDRLGYILFNSSPERFSPAEIGRKWKEIKEATKGDRRTPRSGVPKIDTLKRAAEQAQRQYEHELSRTRQRRGK